MWLKKNVFAAFIAALGLAFMFAGPVGAQTPKVEEPKADEEQFKQVKLTDAHITGFIGAQKEMADLAQKQGTQPSDNPDPKVQAELDAIAKRHGFQSFVEFDDVAFNVSMVMGGLDEQGTFTDPVTSIKKEIEDITADTTIAEKDKKQMLEELNEALKHTPPLQYPENVEIVKKHRAEIEKVLQ
jgi:hypothetical protein